MNKQYIIIDNGSGSIKAGYSDKKIPSVVEQTLLGNIRRLKGGCVIGPGVFTTYFGKDANYRRAILNIEKPIQKGVITNWNQIEKFWDFIMRSKLNADVENSFVMLTETPNNSHSNRVDMCQKMFECFNVKGVYIEKQPKLALYSIGKQRGTVVDSGEGKTQCTSIIDGNIIKESIQNVDITGEDITKYLIKYFNYDNICLTTRSEIDEAKIIKERHCYALLNEDNKKNRKYTMPDGTTITLKDPLYKSIEVLFNPVLCGKEQGGIVDKCIESISKVDISLRKSLYSNIVLVGGNTMYENLPERFTQDIKKQMKEEENLNVTAPFNRLYSVWLGGAILTELSSFKDKWITKKEYEEKGEFALSKID